MKFSRIATTKKFLLAAALHLLPSMNSATPVLPVLLKNQEYLKTGFTCMAENINGLSPFFMAGYAYKMDGDDHKFFKLVMSFDASKNEIKDMIIFETAPENTFSVIEAIAHGKKNGEEILFAYINDLGDNLNFGKIGYIVELDPLNGLIPRG